jgi:hypothetical protein
VLDLVSVQKDVGFSVAAKNMVVDAQITMEDVMQKLMKINTK